jgi:N utilization substance protein A
MDQNLNYLIEQVGRDKGIDKKVIIDALEDAIMKASKKRYGVHKDIEAHYNEEYGEIEIFQFKTVVETIEDSDLEISLQEAKKIECRRFGEDCSSDSQTGHNAEGERCGGRDHIQ